MNRYKLLYCTEQLPVFQNRIFSSPDEARNCTKGDMQLVRDIQTGLIFNQAFSPELLEYDNNYQNEQALSPVFQEHLNAVLSIVDDHLAGCSLIEVGCGKGMFLGMLESRGYAVTGLDPAYEGENPRIVKEYFTPDIGISADAIILRHVLEHVQNPYEFLINIRNSNGGRGKVYIEVPCFDWICDRRAWFDIFYEHVNYFRLADFARMFGCIHDSGHFFGGQYLYAVADLESLRPPVLTDNDGFEFPSNFLDAFERRVATAKVAQSVTPTPVVIWGGASKGVIFSLFMKRAGLIVDYVVDINPAKQGMYLPATGFQVSSPEEMMVQVPRGGDIFVMNGNYLSEIQRMTRGNFNCVAVDYE